LLFIIFLLAKNFLISFVIFFSIAHNLLVNCFMAKRKTALFGGTFDPIHLGHAAVAAAAAEHIGAEKIIFIPTKRSPLKDSLPKASGDALIYWLAGADSIDELPRWYGIVELIDECNLCVMYRAGCEPPDFAKFTALWGPQRVEKLQQNVIRTPLIDMSSTEIRNRLAASRDVTDMLAPPVADYIRKYSLYQSKAKN
jgi:cytidyltransferase-like protein